MRISDWSSDVCSSDLDSMTPVMPPMLNVNKNPIDHIIGTVKCTRPRYMVNSQLKIFTPVGMAMIMVVNEKNELTSAPRSEARRVGKEWVSRVRSRWSPYQ